ncbi:MAG: glycerol kinase [Imperialibacter sp.]|uniref:glycerol kinase n=1 Tax=Imperialibacter sp. TaxID=2038411 RepID=UPI0032EFCE06
MEYISTSALANELDIKSSDLFDKLKTLGWIERKNDKWVLTDIGKQKGGQTRSNPKFGEFVVWPENISLHSGQQRDRPKQINATAIGKHFDISSQRLNLILSELGLIEKDLAAGWEITKLGKSIGGRQFEHETSGANYVLWPESILYYKRLLEVFKENSTDLPQVQTATVSSPQTETQVANINKDNFREKFEAKHRTIDGHYVRSKAEMLIDNWLYQYGLVHAYERKLPIDEDVYCDFYIPSGNGRPQAVYIEFWGLENDPKYTARKNKKIEIYKREGLSLIELTDADLQNIDDILAKKLRQFKVPIG